MTPSFNRFAEMHSICENITLQPVPLSDYPALSDLVAAGLFVDETPTLGGWYKAGHDVANARATLSYHAGSFAHIDHNDWQLPLGVYAGDELVGVQSLSSRSFSLLGIVKSGSWLGRDHRGQGIGTLARHAIVDAAFSQIRALGVASAALATNGASNRVSGKLGYRPNGSEFIEHLGQRAELINYLLDQGTYRSSNPPQVQHENWEPWLQAAGIITTA